MNMTEPPRVKRPQAALLEKAPEVARELGLEWQLVAVEPKWQGLRPDAYVEIRGGGRSLRLVVEAKVRPRTAQVGAIVAELRRFGVPGLLLADYINPELAEALHRQDIPFLDLAGNAFLRGEGLLIWVTGKKDARRIQIERETRRAFQSTGLKVVFALLARPELVREDYRTLARATGVALGSVQWVLRDLVQEGYVLRSGRTQRRLLDLDRLLDEWTLAYPRHLQSRLLIQRYETTSFENWRDVDLRAHRAVWGGEAAAAWMTNHLKPETLTIWVDRVTPRLIADLGLRTSESGRVQVRTMFWSPEAIGEVSPPAAAPGAIGAPVAPPVLVYAELLALGDARTLETGQMIRQEWIDGPFRAYRADTAG
jgi:hypothetical protein